MNLKVTSTPGPYGISPVILQNCATALAEPLTMLYSNSFADHRLPSAGLQDSVPPIFKKGVKTNANNDRPIPVNSVVA